jgi:hypothetical protein
VADVEHGHMGLYFGREQVIGHMDAEGFLVMPERDFDVECERRIEFTTTDPGEPSAPADEGLKWVEDIREECDWWSFGRERADATLLMEEFYQDVMCINPTEKGHKWYLNLAKKHHLDEGKEHNEGFYATIYGKVEVDEGDGRKPAQGAKVRVYAPKDRQEWTTTTDENGEYRIKKVVLHKDCSPFDISAEYKGERVDENFEGPLTDPDRSYEYKKDLFIERPRWVGTLSYQQAVNMSWGDDVTAYSLNVGIQAEVDLDLERVSSPIPIPNPIRFMDEDVNGTYVMRYVYQEVTAGEAKDATVDCTGNLKIIVPARMNIDEKAGTYELYDLTFQHDGACVGGGNLGPNSWQPEKHFLYFDDSYYSEAGTFHTIVEGTFSGRSIQGVWQMPRVCTPPGGNIAYQVPDCGVTVTWHLSKGSQ